MWEWIILFGIVGFLFLMLRRGGGMGCCGGGHAHEPSEAEKGEEKKPSCH